MKRQNLLLLLAGVLGMVFAADRLVLNQTDSAAPQGAQLLLRELLSALRPPSGAAGEAGLEAEGDVETILARPLFSASRRPAPFIRTRSAAPAPVRERRRPVAEDYALLATVIREGQDPVAVLSSVSGGETRRLSVGEEIGSWTVSEIAASSVRFSAGGEVSALSLDTYGRGGEGRFGSGGRVTPGSLNPATRTNTAAQPPGLVQPQRRDN
ncbi:hypothetical protein [Parvularcula maris]|uniref:Type II secretion system protein GspC N-terminal domain-containing protein n=1 Tax=Parvularcula maris TaxID=2965077 RepID=A0A9X2LB95_9PROT|nr:hypothetical protein [Parvularcula maris]MCQ8186492.1 hypothetical protein [Parvularcula maris]